MIIMIIIVIIIIIFTIISTHICVVERRVYVLRNASLGDFVVVRKS